MKKTGIIILIIALVAIIGVLAWWSFNQHSQMQELVEQMEIEKEELQEEYEDLAIQFDGYQQMDIRNDSLQDLLSREQQRVQDLLEELRVTKVTNARKIAELKKELATVRAVMKDYVRQIDSLNVTNARLTEENIRVSSENQQLTKSNEQLTISNEQLTQTVTRAAMLEVVACSCTTLNKKDRKTRILSQVHKLQFDYTIAKNITCTLGIKQLYIRIVDPKGNLLGENNAHLFHFEDQDIPYSVVQTFEYSGEEYNGVAYWPCETEVEQGFYNVDFFCDGNLIGSFPIQIKK